MIGVIVQARMGSTRLPGKVMMEGAGKPLLGHLLERLSYCHRLQMTAVATTTNPGDDLIANYCTSLGVAVYRGSENDVLDRYYQAAVSFGITRVVRVTSDCPLIDPELIDEQLSRCMDKIETYDLITNRHPLTYVDGIDFDIIPSGAWQSCGELPRSPTSESMWSLFWESGMRVLNFEDPQKLFYSQRWTLDYIEDYELIRAIYLALYPNNKRFTTGDILRFLMENPQLAAINLKYLPKQ